MRRKKEHTAIEHVPAPNNEEEYLPTISLSRRFPNVHGVKKRRFLEAFASCGGIREASRRTGIAIRSHYFWKETDPAYVEALDFVTTVQNDVFKEEIARRGFRGYNRPIIYKGQITGYYREFSDELAKLEMKARLAEYRDGNQINIATQGPSQSRSSLPGLIQNSSAHNVQALIPLSRFHLKPYRFFRLGEKRPRLSKKQRAKPWSKNEERGHLQGKERTPRERLRAKSD